MHDKDLTVRDFVKREIPERRNANAILRALMFCGLDFDAPAESILQKSADRAMWSYGIGIMRRSLYAQIREKIKNELEEKTMIKIFCDRCGNEISEQSPLAQKKFPSVTIYRQSCFSDITHEVNFCECCRNDFERFLSGWSLEKEKNNGKL